jgi:hypothetical protein
MLSLQRVPASRQSLARLMLMAFGITFVAYIKVPLKAAYRAAGLKMQR